MKQKLLQEIRDELNKTFPDRLKLKFGCEIVTYGMNEEEIIAKYLRTDDGDDGGYWVDSWHIQDGIPGWGSQPRINQCAKVKEILGTPPTILDVLRYLGDNFAISGDMKIMQYNHDVGATQDWVNILEISQIPLLQDQSLETIQSLHSVMFGKE